MNSHNKRTLKILFGTLPVLMKYIKELSIISLILCVFSIYAHSQTKEKISDKKFSKKELQSDFLQLQKSIENNFPAMYEFTSKSEYNELVNNQYYLIQDSLSLTDFYNICSPVVAKLGSGHSSINYPRIFFRESIMKFFPAKIYWENEKLIVTKMFGKENLPAGSEIIKINDKPVSEIYNTIYNSVPSYGLNKSFISSAIHQRFFMYYVYHFGFYETFKIEFKSPESAKVKEMNIASVEIDFSKKSEQFENNELDSLSLKIIEGNGTAYLYVPTFAYHRNNKVFKDYIDSTFTQIAKNGIKNLIIDLRGNDGGDPFCSAYLLSFLINEPTIYFAGKYRTKPFDYDTLSLPVQPKKNSFTGKLYVLIDGLSFSSTGHLAALIKYHELGVLVGEETGSTYMCYADTDNYLLDNTQLRLRISRAKRCVAVEGFPIDEGVIPDYEIKPNIKDIIEKKDIVLNYTLDLIENE